MKLGVSTALCGCVGDDLFGGVLAARRGRAGSTRQPLRTVADALTSASVVLDRSDGERTFLHNPGASAALTAADVDAALGASGARWLHVGGALVLPALDGEPLAWLLQAARERGVLTSLDPVHDATAGLGAPARRSPTSTAICPNLTEARGISGQHEPRTARPGCTSAAWTAWRSRWAATGPTRATPMPTSWWCRSR